MENIEEPKIIIDHKSQLLEKVSQGNYTKSQLITWIKCLPGSTGTRKPSTNKKGDVYMHPIFKHPYVLLERKRGYWICVLLTSDSECSEILEASESRFFTDSYFTKCLFTEIQPRGTYCNVFDNPKQLNSVLSQLKEIFK
jgi:hypothetical protein